MSRGRGKVEQAIATILDAEPDDAFTARELCEKIFGEPREKKHHVSVLRAMRNLASKAVGLATVGHHGVGVALYNERSIRSTERATAKLKAQHLLRKSRWSNGDGHWRSYKGKPYWCAATYHYRRLSTKDLEEHLLVDTKD